MLSTSTAPCLRHALPLKGDQARAFATDIEVRRTANTRNGATPQEALRTVRTLCPGAVGNPAQEQALYAFAARRDWIL